MEPLGPGNLRERHHLEGRGREQGFETIASVKVHRKNNARIRSSSPRQNLLKAVALLSVFVALLFGGGLLLHYLSRNPVHLNPTSEDHSSIAPVTDPTRVGAPTNEMTPRPLETADQEKPALEKEEAEQRLGEFIGAKKELDRMGASQWGGAPYARILQLNQEADALFLNKEYASASDKYIEATSEVGELVAQTENALRQVIAEGQIALAEGKGEHAQQKFGVALMIDPGNAIARRGLERAQKAETVIGLIESARRHEKEGDLLFALADYREALRLDPDWHQARKASKRVKDLIAGEQFQRAMSSGLTALHNNDYGLARAEFLKARDLKPASQEVQDALAQADQGLRLARIQELCEKASSAEQSEDWDRALKSYLAVLKIDPNVRFATVGKARSLEQIRISKNIGLYLEKPALLESDRHLHNALQLLSEVSMIEPKGPRLTRQTEMLDRIVKIAQTPVTIVLESDNLTDVAVYKIGKLGRFLTRDLELRPGSYTVVGTRKGYKDIRRKIVVRAGNGQLHVTVKCSERI